ncbi:MAG: hypothetical protein HY619_05450 [Thaumarchaeota archaeon]|nr:hypothetical protein [Nitrososphaerota archaeon]
MKSLPTRCPNCGTHRVIVVPTKASRGKHYHCDKCNYEWQNRTVRRRRRRITLYRVLMQRVLEKRDLLNSQDRFFVEKTVTRDKTNLRHHTRLRRIAHKIGLDLREDE